MHVIFTNFPQKKQINGKRKKEQNSSDRMLCTFTVLNGMEEGEVNKASTVPP